MCASDKKYKNCGEFPKKPVYSYGCATAIGSSNCMTKDIAIDCLKDVFQLMISQLCE